MHCSPISLESLQKLGIAMARPEQKNKPVPNFEKKIPWENKDKKEKPKSWRCTICWIAATWKISIIPYSVLKRGYFSNTSFWLNNCLSEKESATSLF